MATRFGWDITKEMVKRGLVMKCVQRDENPSEGFSCGDSVFISLVDGTEHNPYEAKQIQTTIDLDDFMNKTA